ncbi:hypothetical protein SAMN05216605_10287 [Pseudomonas abietaniphila]|uniref:Uncharacterized protein n=1 Tax=Pseudomonas abietaniphila TaxID=89065 RepID=A0A1G7U922_9PSED|nr:hypothetical protein SAMN05216605_10287 [Pseudomonas abietaniphila]
MSEGLLVNVLFERVAMATPLHSLWERIHSRLAIPSSNTLYQRRNGKPSAVLLTVRLACVR